MKLKNESGRSMVEMLGVLAVIGVLSVGGIIGYRYAMNKYSVNTLENLIQIFTVALEDKNMFTYEYENVYEQRRNDSEVFCKRYLNDEWCSDWGNTDSKDYMSYPVPNTNARWYVNLSSIHGVEVYTLGLLIPKDIFSILSMETMYVYGPKLKYLGHATGLIYTNGNVEDASKVEYVSQEVIKAYPDKNLQREFKPALVRLNYNFFAK